MPIAQHMSTLLQDLQAESSVITAELRPRAPSSPPPRAWMRGLTRSRGQEPDPGQHVRLSHRQRRRTQGRRQPQTSRHQPRNDVPRARIAPFLTTKHPLEYCLAYADRASQHGFESLSCSAATRASVRRGASSMPGSFASTSAPSAGSRTRWLGQPARGSLGASRSPPRRARDRRVLSDADRLHYSRPQVERFLDEAGRRSLTLPGSSECSITAWRTRKH